MLGWCRVIEYSLYAIKTLHRKSPHKDSKPDMFVCVLYIETVPQGFIFSLFCSADHDCLT